MSKAIIKVSPVGATYRPVYRNKRNALALELGETGHAHLVLDRRPFSYWDVSSHTWQIAPGTYRIMVGASSRDIRLRAQITEEGTTSQTRKTVTRDQWRAERAHGEKGAHRGYQDFAGRRGLLHGDFLL